MSDGKRAFMMGNALVVGLVEQIADSLIADVAEPASVRNTLRRRRIERLGRTPTPKPATDQPGRPQRDARQPSARHRALN